MNLRNLSGVRILWKTIYAQQGRLVLQQYSYTLTLKWSRSCQQCRIRFSIKWKWLLITSLICPTKKSRIYSTKLLSPANRVNLTITNPRVGWKRCKEINRANYLYVLWETLNSYLYLAANNRGGKGGGRCEMYIQKPRQRDFAILMSVNKKT